MHDLKTNQVKGIGMALFGGPYHFLSVVCNKNVDSLHRIRIIALLQCIVHDCLWHWEVDTKVEIKVT